MQLLPVRLRPTNRDSSKKGTLQTFAIHPDSSRCYFQGNGMAIGEFDVGKPEF